MSLIQHTGIIHFDPINKTKKHELQADWKRVALIMFTGDICEYYAWFLEKRYNLKLNKPLRGPHVSLINDSLRDIRTGTDLENDVEIEALWEAVKNKWDNQPISVTFDTDLRSDGRHWWLNIPNEHRNTLHAIRQELGLGRPFWGLHLSVGYAADLRLEHSEYILRCITTFGEDFC